MTFITGKENYDAELKKSASYLAHLQLLQWKHALKAEMLGIKFNRGGQPTVYSLVKQRLGFKGSREKVLTQLEQYIEDHKEKLGHDD